MNKTVLFLVNGLGIEHAESCDIYNKEVMPVMDQCAISDFFASIESQAINYTTGYQIFSTGSTDALAFPFVDKIVDENEWNKNTVYQSLKKSLQAEEEENGIHIFCFLDSPRIAEHLKSFITSLEVENKTIFVHPIMTGLTMESYKTIAKILHKISYDSTIHNVKIGVIFGKNLLLPTDKVSEFNDLGRMLFRGTGEKWTNIDQKIESLQSFKTLPCDAKIFCVNDQFGLKTNDTIIFYNYDDADCSKFIELLTNPPSFFNSQVSPGSLKFYSLFPLKNTAGVQNIFESVKAEFSLSKALSQYGMKGLVLIDQENLNIANYMINGLDLVGDGTLDYALTDSGILFNQAQMQAVLQNEKYQVIIINHRIDQYNDENSMKQALNQIDQSLNLVKSLCQDKHTLVISSLFGIKKTIVRANGKEGIVDFSNRVPVIIVDSRYDKKEYMMTTGNLYTLLSTIIKLSHPDAKVQSILKKKGFIERLLYKSK